MSLSWRGLRAVATTRWPASRAACANALPKPRELPVMSQAFDSVTCMLKLSRMAAAIRCSFVQTLPWEVPISGDGTCLLLAERKNARSQLDRLLQKDQVAR